MPNFEFAGVEIFVFTAVLLFVFTANLTKLCLLQHNVFLTSNGIQVLRQDEECLKGRRSDFKGSVRQKQEGMPQNKELPKMKWMHLL